MSLNQLFHLSANASGTLQNQVRECITKAILEGHVPPDVALPSTRAMAKMLNVSRNTIIFAYDELIADGFLVAKARAGFYVDERILKGRLNSAAASPPEAGQEAGGIGPNWAHFLKQKFTLRKLNKHQWHPCPYPFIYGQLDANLFPAAHWRECCVDAVRVAAERPWFVDHYDEDDEQLIEQIRTRVLPRRGIWASPEEILITVGAQHALFMLTSLLLNGRATFGMEEPGYPDIHKMATLTGAEVRHLGVDDEGLVVDDRLAGCDIVFTTPSHQFPTTVTLPLMRRRSLLLRAVEDDFLIIEDDYESETNFASYPTPALKSLDRHQRVIYVGSLSKTLAPGLRLGFIVAPTELVSELREYRRMMLRHPPTNNQRAMGLFIARGYHDSLVRHMLEVYEERWTAMRDALQRHLPGSASSPVFGGSAYWVRGAEDLDARVLKRAALSEGIVLESGDMYFFRDSPPLNWFRLGYSSLGTERIAPGIERLAEVIRRVRGVPRA